MNDTIPDSVDIQNVVDNFEAVIKSGDVKLIAQNGETKLYQGQNGIEYIYDGSSAYSETSDDFVRLKSQNFDK